MRVNGTLINYYFHCKRQCYLHGNRLNLEDNSEIVQIGKAIHEERLQSSNSEIAIENIKLDKLTKEYLTEIKKSDYDVEAAKWQLLYYLSVLKNKGIYRKGKLEFVEKNKSNKKVVILELTEKRENELKKIIESIEKLLNCQNVLIKVDVKNVHIMSIVTYERRGNMGSTRYIMSMGELSRKDNSICFRKNGKNVYIPIENTKELFCLNEVSLNSKLLDFLSQNHVIVHFFNYYGMYSGTFYPKDQYLSGRLLIAQVNKYQTDRLKIAQAIVKVIGDNIAEILYHYYKHNKKEVKETIDWLRKDFVENVLKSQTIE